MQSKYFITAIIAPEIAMAMGRLMRVDFPHEEGQLCQQYRVLCVQVGLHLAHRVYQL